MHFQCLQKVSGFSWSFISLGQYFFNINVRRNRSDQTLDHIQFFECVVVFIILVIPFAAVDCKVNAIKEFRVFLEDFSVSIGDNGLLRLQMFLPCSQ